MNPSDASDPNQEEKNLSEVKKCSSCKTKVKSPEKNILSMNPSEEEAIGPNQEETIPSEVKKCPISKTKVKSSEKNMPSWYNKEPTVEFLNRAVAKNTHNLLGRTGLKVSKITLGTMNFGNIDTKLYPNGRPGQLNEAEAHKILDKFVELGGNCIDTANFFPWFGTQADPTNVNSGGASRNNLIHSVDESLERLQTNYIDILQLEGYDLSASISETVRHLDDLVTARKIAYFGVSDFKGWQLQKMIDVTRQMNTHKCVVASGEYNLLTRGCELEVCEVCRNEDLAFFGYAPLKYGSLIDEINPESPSPLPGSRIEAASGDKPDLVAMAISIDDLKKNPNFQNTLKHCQVIAKKRNLTSSQVALLWALQRKVTSVVVGVSNLEELEENMNVMNGDILLSFEEMTELTEISRAETQYPYNTNLTSMSGYKAIHVTDTTAFEQLTLLHHRSSIEEIVEKCDAKCEAKLDRTRYLTTKSFNR